MKILFLCNKSPWPPREGGPMAMNMFIEGLILAGHQVKVVAVNTFKYHISSSDIPASYRERSGIELVEVDLRLKPVMALMNLLSGKSYHVTRFDSRDFQHTIIRILHAENFDIVQLETMFMGPFIETVRANSRAKIVLRAHNIEHQIWERIARETRNPLKKWYLTQLAGSLKVYEKKVAGLVDGIVPITETDAEFFKGLIGNKTSQKTLPISAIPFGVNLAGYQHPEITTEAPSLFTLGSMNWIPNQKGIRWFVEHVWPDVHKQFPKLKYYLAGRAMPVWMSSLNIPNIIVLGEVEDASRFLAEKSIMIVPLFSGSGIRVKIIEGMAAGKTIISTTLGAEGIHYTHRKNILIADTPCEFFELISICAMEPETCRKLGTAAKSLIESDYQPAILVQKLVAFYERLRD